jgi:hypothetical protein
MLFSAFCTGLQGHYLNCIVVVDQAGNAVDALFITHTPTQRSGVDFKRLGQVTARGL